MLLQNSDVLLNGDADVMPGFLYGHAVAETTWQARTVGKVPLVFRLFLDHYLKIIELYGSNS